MLVLDPNSNAFERVIAGASLFLNVATGGVLPNAGGFIRAGRHLCSFHEDTQVATHQGFVKISEIRAGEHKVWARDEHTGQMTYQSVLDAYSNRYHKTVTVRIRDLQSDTYQTIVSNTIHPFYVSMVQPGLRLVANGGVAIAGTNDTGEWIEAQHLQAGQHLLNADESWSEVVSVSIAKQDLRAYNLHVDQFHTFYVRGADNDNAPGVWVHNTCFGDLTKLEIDQIQSVVKEAGRPLEVVGSAAKGTRRGVGTNLPLGKGIGTKSDIDFLIPPSSKGHFQGVTHKLPDADVNIGTANPHIGPSIRFEP